MSAAAPPRIHRSAAVRLAAAAALGALFAIGIHSVWSLEGRWFVIVVVAIALLAISLVWLGRFADRLLVLVLFCIPLAGFKKFLFLDDYVAWTNALGIGIVEIMLVGLYFAWACRIFVLREEDLPRPVAGDAWVALALLATALSAVSANDLSLVAYAFGNLSALVLVYFYISRNFHREHLPWLAGAIAFAAVLDGALALVQNRLGILAGLILDKGAGGDQLNERQYAVPGIEDITRGTGLTYDSHSLGLYMGMLLPFALVFIYDARLPRWMRGASLAVFLAATTGLVVSYSRSAWLCTGGVLALGVAVLWSWRDRYVLGSVIAAAMAALLTAPWVFFRLFGRLFDAPDLLLSERFRQFPIALSIWSENWLLGAGAGNYIDALSRHNQDWAFEVLVHNVPLLIGSETGLLGVVAFYGALFSALARLWRLTRVGDDLLRRFALAAFLSLLVYILDGMTDPLFREPTVYMMCWVLVGLSVALARQAKP